MKPKIFRILQFIASLLVLMEGIRQLDTGFNFPWIYFISGIVMLTLVPLSPVLNSKYYLTGALIYFAETVLLFIVGLHYWNDMKRYGALIYIVTAVLLCIAGIRNIRKA
jgi:hypothetical protein